MTFSKVREILARHKGIEPQTISEDSTFDSLGLDSLDVVELIMQFEDEFGVMLSLNEDLKTVADFVNLINEGKKND